MVLLATGDIVSFASFATVIGEPDGITSTSLSSVFSISNRISRRLLNTMRKKEKETQQNCCSIRE